MTEKPRGKWCADMLEGVRAKIRDKKYEDFMCMDIQALNWAIVTLRKVEWIPVKYRPLTTEERIEFAEHYGIEYCDTVDEKAFDCPMPEDGQEILVSGSWGVSTDVADNDVTDGGYTLFGLEGNGDWEGIDAWMPLPKPYKKGGTE